MANGGAGVIHQALIWQTLAGDQPDGLFSALVARIVEPIAPNFSALRRVSASTEREKVSTSSPCSMSV